MKILIDPAYLNLRPFHLLPRFFCLPVDRFVPSFLWGSRLWAGPFPWWAFGPDGFDGMDLGFFYTYLFRPDLTLREAVLERYRSCRWPIRAFHGTFPGESRFFRETSLDLGEDGERTRRGLLNHVRVAAEIGGKGSVLVLHPGTARAGTHKAMDTLVANLETCLPEAERRQVVLALENMPRSLDGGTRYLGADYRELREVLRRLPSPFLKVCLDLGHANNYGEVHARNGGLKDVERYVRRFGYCREVIRELGPEIVYAHVHYNRSHVLPQEALRRNLDEHMPLSHIPGDFWPDFRETLRLLFRDTSVCRTGFVNLELVPGRLFGHFRVMRMGGGPSEQRSSVRLVREVLAAIDPPGEGR